MRERSWATIVVLLAALTASCHRSPQVANQEYLKSGDAFVGQKKYAEAAIQDRNAIQQDPRSGEARRKLAAVALLQGDIATSYNEGIRAADLLPNSAAAQVDAGQLLLLARKWEDAQARAEKALAIDPKNVPAQLLKANALAGLEKVDDAVAEVEEAIHNDPARIAGYTSLGTLQYLRGNQEAAEAAFRQALSTNPKSLEAHVGLANFLSAVGRQADAEVEFRAALELDPKNLLANRALAAFYVTARRPTEAEPYFKALAGLMPNDEGSLTLADFYTANGRVAEARSILEKIAGRVGRSSSPAKLRLAALSAEGGDLLSAKRLIEEVLAKEPANTEALLGKAEVAVRQHQLDDALETLQTAVKNNPSSAPARYALGRLFVLRRESKEAADAFGEALKLNPRMAPADFELAKLALAERRLDEAEKFAREALNSQPAYVSAALALAQIYLLQQNADKAEPIIQRLAKALPDSPTVKADLGRLAVLRKDDARARDAFEAATRMNPTELSALGGLVAMDLREHRTAAARARLDAAVRAAPRNSALLAMACRFYYVMGDREAAERAGKQALESDPSNMDAYSLLGTLYISTHRVEDAIAEFSNAAKVSGSAVWPYTVIGVLLQMQNRPSEAQVRYEQALARDPRAAVAANNLACIYMDQNGKLDEALQLAKTAKAGLPHQPEVNDTLGWVLYKIGQSSQALPPLLEAVEKDPANATYQYHLGLVYVELRQPTKARQALEKSLSLLGTGAEADAARQALARLG